MAANVKIRVPNLPRWKQISGDMDPGKYGALVARSDGNALELFEIQPVREYVGDEEAADFGFPFWSKEAYYDLDDLSPRREEVRRALESMDVDLEGGTGAAGDPEWTPESRALAIAEALFRYGDGVNEANSGWSSDVVPGEVEWWGGVGGPEFIADEDDEFRRDILGEDDEEDEFESNSGRVTLKKIPKSEVSAWQYGLRHHKGQKGPRGIPFGKRIQYQGRSWLVYDFDADATATGGVTLVLVAPDFTESVRGVELSHAMSRPNPVRRNPGRGSAAASFAGGRGPNPGKFDTDLDEMVYGISLDGGGDEEVGEADALGFALIMRNGADIVQALHDNPPGFAPRAITRDERDFLMNEGSAGVIVFVDSAGFVQVVYYDNERELEEDWSKTVDKLSAYED